ncbi:hypothetical protein [Ketogulonicigenium vulgare]|uniref:Lipoprotein n=1 Tax=Ketogulonicigenium vulgare (strain WSH-001) TaxID=759362 RepID=F9Y3B9_KETVW|nr:hypothetical protein [Ketogulonicigenium vulgare]ADO42156.1 hypothetical protein EIO_1009 [Ketogulonicigenium vulgare Y25]AEM40360.1 hypothetical protein KVU_0521 [Ketogulonicigenium vulgare WSH-001]ALJ80549.1 hypothetical protein KVH_04790 [Ketogulonicigenium vulgare]AOZ54073.1 hypothetical protein KVC_1056 [Ketogulonicigenium vulgare]
MKKYLISVAFLPLLAGCVVIQPAVPREPEPLPANVAAALPAGAPESVVIQNSDGCYLYSVEVTTPPSGYPLRDGAGNPICAAR